MQELELRPKPSTSADEMRRAALSTQRLAGASALSQIGETWAALDALQDTPMQQSLWTESWLSASGAGDRLRVLVATSPLESPSIAALVHHGGLSPSLLPAGAIELGEPVDLSRGGPGSLRALCQALARDRHPVHLPRVLATSPTIPALREAYRRRGVVRVGPAKPCPFVPLDTSWSEPERHLSPRRRQDLRRAERHAERQGKLSYSFLSPAPEEAEGVLDEAFRVEAACWKGREGTAMSSDLVIGTFFRTYALAAARRGILRVAFLRIGGLAAAMQLAVEHAGRYWLLKIGYDEAFRQASPGILLLRESLRRAAEQGLSTYEFLGGVAPWIKPWTNEERATVSLGAYPVSLASASALSSQAAARVLRTLRRQFRWMTRSEV
ncbi:GNAT family N-acetyltransferase [Polyangium jinanense]|uniref:GNAT family N-acetyltransferase n=1 Tax=Polyangium jinanense TaxID=2829994 RepID=A0A9X3X8V7_9BACT|nr:GNAT family N-acetyltransferase [Polyangium jinanense]MDC3960209.1 GNAT family N-acetyltransferase [Polyangium jinanense]MDC3984925.1 GNAT family N-acetyltransferase [Polyangium jinanense]